MRAGAVARHPQVYRYMRRLGLTAVEAHRLLAGVDSGIGFSLRDACRQARVIRDRNRAYA
jgi:hypothetical protein